MNDEYPFNLGILELHEKVEQLLDDTATHTEAGQSNEACIMIRLPEGTTIDILNKEQARVFGGRYEYSVPVSEAEYITCHSHNFLVGLYYTILKYYKEVHNVRY